MLVRIVNLEEMKNIFEEFWSLNHHLKMSRTELFQEFGYGDDFGGYCFPLPETVEKVGVIAEVTPSDSMRIRNNIALTFEDEEFIRSLAESDAA